MHREVTSTGHWIRSFINYYNLLRDVPMVEWNPLPLLDEGLLLSELSMEVLATDAASSIAAFSLASLAEFIRDASFLRNTYVRYSRDGAGTIHPYILFSPAGVERILMHLKFKLNSFPLA